MYMIKYREGFADLTVIPNAPGVPDAVIPEDLTYKTFSNEEELKKLFSGPELVALYNAVGDNEVLNVKRFATREDGARRTFGMIARLYPETPAEAAAPSTATPPSAANEATTPEEGEDMASKKKAKAKAPKAKKEKGAKALIRKDSSRGKLLTLAVENSGAITLAQIAARAGVSGEGSMDAPGRARMRLRVVAEIVGGTFEVGEDKKVSFKLPAGTTLAKVFGE